MKKLILLLTLISGLAKTQTIKSFTPGTSLMTEAGASEIISSGYVVAGKYITPSETIVNYVIKYDKHGNVSWTRNEMGGDLLVIIDIAEGFNGELYFLGEDVAGNSYYPLIKTDSLGNVIWSVNLDKTLYGSYGSPRIKPDTDGNIFVLSSTYEKTHLYKLSSTGTLLWSRTIEVDNITQKNPGFDLVLDGNGGVICTGKAEVDVYMFRVSASGNLLWNVRLNDLGNSYAHARSITALNNGSFLVAGFRGESAEPYRNGPFLLNIDSLGNILHYEFYYDTTGMFTFVPDYVYELPNHDIRVIGNGGPLTFMDFSSDFTLQNYFYWGTLTNAQSTPGCYSIKGNDMLMTCGDRLYDHYILRSSTWLNDFCDIQEVDTYTSYNLPVNTSQFTDEIFFTTGPLATAATYIFTNTTQFGQHSFCGAPEITLSAPTLEKQDNIQIEVYPTVLVGAAPLTIRLPEAMPYSLALMSASGSVVFESQGENAVENVSLPSVEAGVYLVRLQGKNLNEVKKIIIQ